MKPKKVIVVLEKGKDDFGAWAENIPGIYGAGETEVKALESFCRAWEIFYKENHNLI